MAVQSTVVHLVVLNDAENEVKLLEDLGELWVFLYDCGEELEAEQGQRVVVLQNELEEWKQLVEQEFIDVLRSDLDTF